MKIFILNTVYTIFNFSLFYPNENYSILIPILLMFVPEGSTDNMLALVPVMTWCWTDDKPLHEPNITHFVDIYASPGQPLHPYIAAAIFNPSHKSLRDICHLLSTKPKPMLWNISFHYCEKARDPYLKIWHQHKS